MQRHTHIICIRGEKGTERKESGTEGGSPFFVSSLLASPFPFFGKGARAYNESVAYRRLFLFLGIEA